MTYGFVSAELRSCDRCQAVVPVRGVEIHSTWCLRVYSLVVAQDAMLERNKRAILEELNRPWRDGQPQP